MRIEERLAVDGGTPVRTTPLPRGRGISYLGPEERAAVLDVLESRSLFRYYGPNLLGKVAAFEQAAADLLGAEHTVATSSGTAALRTALAALRVGCGDEVIVPAFTFIATVNAVVVSGAVPVFAEVDASLNLDPTKLEEKISPRTTAIVPVHLENVGCNMGPILEIARRRGVAVLEDTAQSMGATYKGKALGSLGDFGAFSLQLEKNITAGEGGLVATNDDELYLRAARYQDQGGQFVTSHGATRGDELAEAFIGENLRMTEIAGAISHEQIKKLPAIVEAMRTNKRRILSALGDVDGLERRHIPDPEGDGGSSITWFAPDATTARAAAKALRAEGIPSAQIYNGQPVYANPTILEKRTATGKGGPWNCAEHPCEIDYRMGMCPQTEAIVARVFTVGVGALFAPADCNDVAEAVGKVARHLLR